MMLSDDPEIPRYCIIHSTYECDMEGATCEYLPRRDSDAYKVSCGSALAWRTHDDGTYVCVYAMGANYRLCVGVDIAGIDRAWCYNRSMIEPIRKALTEWDGKGMPPDGWHRDIRTGMRRTNGDPAQEYFNP